MPYANYQQALDRAKWRYARNKDKRKAQVRAWNLANPKQKAYLDQRACAKRRKIEFNLTFEEWVDFWGEDFRKRGIRRKDLHMCRYDDIGAYEVGNIYKDTQENNKLGPQSKPKTPV